MSGYPLLDDSDLEFIRTLGIKCRDCPDLLELLPDGRVMFTIKGLQFYKCACEAHALPFTPHEWQDEQALWRLALEMSRVRMRRIEAEVRKGLERGTLNPADREYANAMLDGSVDELLEAARRRAAFSLAGANVIPVRFGNQGPASF